MTSCSARWEEPEGVWAGLCHNNEMELVKTVDLLVGRQVHSADELYDTLETIQSDYKDEEVLGYPTSQLPVSRIHPTPLHGCRTVITQPYSIILFWHGMCVFSNFFMSEFRVAGITFWSVEQYYQFWKSSKYFTLIRRSRQFFRTFWRF